MKRRNNLYDSMLDYEKIKRVYNKLRVTTKNKKEVIRFSLYLNENLMDILTKLYKGRYVFNKCRIFLIKEPKYRLIMSECIEDKIVNHLLSDELINSLERVLLIIMLLLGRIKEVNSLIMSLLKELINSCIKVKIFMF